MKKILHEVRLSELNPENRTLSEHNEELFKLFLQIALLNGHKIQGLVCGQETAKMLQNLPGSGKELKEDSFYKMGYHGIIPMYVDTSLGDADILVICKKGIEKIRVLDLQ